jgi:endonuclease/exonuclease/phosphatase (EEP) superfamily protein YafD
MVVLGVVFAVSSIGLASCPSEPKAASSSGVLRIATVNLKAQNAEPEQAAAALAGARPDVLLLQEWTGRNAGRTPFREAGLQLVRSDARRGTHGSALLARPGIVQAARVVSPPWSGPCAMPLMTARLRSGGASIGLIGAHGPPPVAGCQDSRAPYLRALATLVSDGRAARSVGVIPRGTPLVVAGDLNALGWEAPLRSLTERGLTDGFDAGSWRLGPTWTPHPWLPALAAIDYLLMPAEWQAQGAWTVAVPGSDHRAVVVDVSP